MDRFHYALPQEIRDLLDEHVTEAEMPTYTAEALIKRVGDLVGSNSRRFNGRYQQSSSNTGKRKRDDTSTDEAVNLTADAHGQAGANYDSSKLTAAQRQYRMKNSLCFWCGKPGHLERNCRAKKAGKKTANHNNNDAQPGDPTKKSKAAKRADKFAKMIDDRLSNLIIQQQPGTSGTSGEAQPGTLMALNSQGTSTPPVNVPAQQGNQQQGSNQPRQQTVYRLVATQQQ